MDAPLVRQLQETKTFLATLKNSVNSRQDVLAWFQALCGRLCDLLLKIAHSIRSSRQAISPNEKETMLLYLLQLNTTLSVLIKIFTTECDIGITINESRYSILQQIIMCLTGLENVINSNIPNKDTSIGFVKYMDLTLDKITEIDVEQGFNTALESSNMAKKVLEEVLCHAMSIAQVALKEDCSAIKGSSKEVLHNFDYLTWELTKEEPSISLCNLSVDYLCDKLCALERKVNAAVLKLTLKVFSECTKPLEDLHQFCLKSCQDEAALDEMVADFDLHVDRMIQVGLFAVSCSTDRNCTLKMRSCLASLEALEGELVPAMTALIKDSTVRNLYHAEMLKHYWMKQATDLKKHIYLIIDPLAFCQVTFEVIRDINADLEERFRDVANVDKNHVKPITLQSKILYEMLLVSLVDSPPENQDIIRKYLNDVICVTMEIDAAAEKLLKAGEMCKENVFRVFKRCKVQENILKKLLQALGSSLDKPVSSHGDESGVKEVGNRSSGEEEVLEQITIRGKQILKDRSVLYKTPNKSSLQILPHVKTNSTIPLSRLVHLRNMQFSHSRSIMEASSCDLQLTDILDNLTALSTSLQK